MVITPPPPSVDDGYNKIQANKQDKVGFFRARLSIISIVWSIITRYKQKKKGLFPNTKTRYELHDLEPDFPGLLPIINGE